MQARGHVARSARLPAGRAQRQPRPQGLLAISHRQACVGARLGGGRNDDFYPEKELTHAERDTEMYVMEEINYTY